MIRSLLVRRGLYGVCLAILALWVHDLDVLTAHLR